MSLCHIYIVSLQCDYRQPSTETATLSSGKILAGMSSSSWSRGAYQCLCKRGFYSLRHPDGFNGTIMEIAWQEHQDNISNYYSDVFKCLPCSPGCDTCTGPEPCLANYHWPFRCVAYISLLSWMNIYLSIVSFAEYPFWPYRLPAPAEHLSWLVISFDIGESKSLRWPVPYFCWSHLLAVPLCIWRWALNPFHNTQYTLGCYLTH